MEDEYEYITEEQEQRNNEILDLAERLMNKIEDAGYSTTNNAGFKDVAIHILRSGILEVENVTSNPRIRIRRSKQERRESGEARFFI